MLSKDQIEKLKEIETPWGEIGYLVYKRTYSRRLVESDKNSPTEEFIDSVTRVVNACNRQLNVGFTPEEEYRFAEILLELKGSVAGRFLWQLGTKTVDKLGMPSLQNCFHESTEFVTSKGIKKFSDFSDGDLVVIKGQSSWKEATVKNFGKGNLVTLTVSRLGKKREIKTTLDHRWITMDFSENNSKIVETRSLKAGDILRKTAPRTNFHNLSMCNVGVQHGLVFGDGHYSENAKCCAFVPCGDSADEYRKFFYNGNNEKREITGLPCTWKNIPSFDMNKHYIYGFLAGWFAADGSISESGSMVIANKSYETLNEMKGLFAMLDVYCSEIKLSRSVNPFDGTPSSLYRMNIYRENLTSDFLIIKKHKDRWNDYNGKQHWKVESVSDEFTTEDVWCIVEPEKEEFTLANGILTKNCAAVVVNEPVRPFTWAMDLLMLGCGVGFNIQREYVYQIPKLRKEKIKITRLDEKDADFILSDTREAWVKLLGKVLKAHFYTGKGFTYSCQLLRSAGEPIKSFGGVASGSAALEEGIELINAILNNRAGKKLRSIDCLDIMNIIGMIVVSGNVRRSAELAIGDHDDLEYLKAKRWDLGTIPNWRANSNNSIVPPKNFDDIPAEFWKTYEEGEPYGLINLDLSQKIGRTGEYQYPDPDVVAYNPCAEQSLANHETCCLAEIFLPNIKSKEELFEVATYLYRVNKHSLAIPCAITETEDIVHQNMRMGIGVTGILQATEEQKSWLSDCYEYLREYDVKYSNDNGFPTSIKITTVKPSGSLSLLAGVTPGAHPNPAGNHYIRRVRMATSSPLINICKDHGYFTEFVRGFDGTENKGTTVVEFPCSVPEGTVLSDSLGAIKHLEIVQWLQKNWSDNSVSCSIYYKKEELPEIKAWLSENFNKSLKTASFMLSSGHGFDQAPYETITKEQYDEMSSKVRRITSASVSEKDFELHDCDAGGCPIK